MSDFYVFAAIATLFYAGLNLKKQLKFKLCTICLAVSVTWVGLLILRGLGWFSNDLLLALLLGESVVGGYYLLDARVKKDLLVFRLPALLSLTYGAYATASKELDYWVIILIASLWLIHAGIYLYRGNPKIKHKVDELIACCGEW